MGPKIFIVFSDVGKKTFSLTLKVHPSLLPHPLILKGIKTFLLAPDLLGPVEPGALGGGVCGVPVLLCFVSYKKELSSFLRGLILNGGLG